MPYEIDGVTLLNVIGPDASAQVFTIVACIIVLLLAAVAIGIFIWMLKNIDNTADIAIAILVAVIAACGLALGIGGLCSINDERKHPQEHSKYEVLIDDDASFTEITDRYDIETTKGKIYVLKPKK